VVTNRKIYKDLVLLALVMTYKLSILPVVRPLFYAATLAVALSGLSCAASLSGASSSESPEESPAQQCTTFLEVLTKECLADGKIEQGEAEYLALVLYAGGYRFEIPKGFIRTSSQLDDGSWKVSIGTPADLDTIIVHNDATMTFTD
jgi:hypothetical protein